MVKNQSKILTGFLLVLSLLLLNSCSNMVVLNSRGPVGTEEAFLIRIAFILMLIVVLPVFVMVIWFTVHYRASNKKATYRPDWAHSNKIEWVIWLVPLAIVISLSWLTWVKTHELDPYKPLKPEIKPVNIEVVSTDWNWLFIYPDYNIAVVNHLVIPANTPLSFKLTSASVMTSFFIPQLGSQIYVMAGMRTRLHLLAEHEGTYFGQNMEFSGNGYVTMHFDVEAVSQEKFREWIDEAGRAPRVMNMAAYEEFSTPNINYPVTRFSSVTPGLFNNIMMQFMGWMGGADKHMDMPDIKHNMHQMPGMEDSGNMDNDNDSMVMKSDSGQVQTKTMEGK